MDFVISLLPDSVKNIPVHMVRNQLLVSVIHFIIAQVAAFS